MAGGGFDLFWAAVHPGKFLSADTLALPDFYFLFPPRIKHKCSAVNS